MTLWSRNIRIFCNTASDSSAVLCITSRGKACCKTYSYSTSHRHFIVPTHVRHSPITCDVGMPFALTLEHKNTESSCCSCRVPVHVIYQFERTNPRGLQTAKINLLMPFFVLLNGSLWRYSVQVWCGRCSTVFHSFTP